MLEDCRLHLYFCTYLTSMTELCACIRVEKLSLEIEEECGTRVDVQEVEQRVCVHDWGICTAYSFKL